MQITAITPQKRDKNRFNIFIDETFAFGVDADTLLKLGLYKNQNLTQEEIDKIIRETEYAKWYMRALDLISRRPRTEKEIADYFKKKELGESLTKMVLDKLIALKFLDDRAFARWFIEQRQTFRPKGKRLLALELKQKGVPEDICREVLEETVTSENEVGQAKKVVQKKLFSWRNLAKPEKKQKIAAFLSRRGFSWDTITQILPDILSDSFD